MKDTSKVIIGATLVMVVTLAFVIALILVLLAELYCSLLLRRHKLKNQNINNNTQTLNNSNSTTTLTNVSSPSHATQHSLSPPQNFSNIYSQGVLQAPRNILFPCMENISKQQQKNLHQIIHIQTQQESLISSPTLSMSPFTSRAPQPQKNTTIQSEISCLEEKIHQLVYISNPIYENEEEKESGVNSNTPFETPNSSPSYLAKSDSSSDDDVVVAGEIEVCVDSPPLTPMKKLDAEACSVSLRDARSLGTNGSDSIISRSVNDLSSSSSGSPSTSSW